MPWPTRVWPRPALKSFTSTNRSIPGKQPPAARRRPPFVCNRIWAKRILPSASAPIGLMTITNRPCASLPPRKVFCLTIATSARSLPPSVAARDAGRNLSLSMSELGSSTRKIRTLRATSYIPIRRLRQWPAARRAVERWCQLAPDSLVAKIQLGYLDFFQRGPNPHSAKSARANSGRDRSGWPRDRGALGCGHD